jgi:hypothetical protein
MSEDVFDAFSLKMLETPGLELEKLVRHSHNLPKENFFLKIRNYVS